MDTVNSRRRALKFGLRAAAALAAFGLDVKVDKKSGFDVGVTNPGVSVGISEANATCGAGLNCPGGGGECGAGLNCPGGGGVCGAGLNCPGGGGVCGAGLNCPGS
jgi:hypothetical protein